MNTRCVPKWISSAITVVISSFALFSACIGANAEEAVLSAPVDRRPAPLDDACAEVNAAFERTVGTSRFSYRIKAVNDGKLNPISEEARVVDNALYLKRSGGEWSRHDLRMQLPITPQGAMFHICVRHSATVKEIHYSAWMTEEGPMVPIDIWVSAATGKFVRTVRNYSPTGQMYHARTVEQKFNYRQSKAAMPKRYMPDVTLSDIWEADADLR
ncbi:hypothetical protein [Rhizobium sp. BK376]|uniref:hypothetical protein n=1 Tax=Rhizobium sp. BK376 TaxID=2512149 RepID=UPI00104DE513|nr:hypothetical protein [Rhizobium sp. BK376]TCR93291.1 hypothetical protein EV561_101737 [Rhizobium sp. BK376]